MASRKSIMHPRVEELGVLSPSCSSPLRRRSSIAQRTVPTRIEENDDEAERQNRRLDSSIPQGSPSSSRRSSIGLAFISQMSNPQIAEKVQQCIQLSAENKINTKNAFSLQMIDFMAFMIKKKDTNMNNLQVASTSLDVSTKIYGLRVDSVHSDVMKMSGGMEKQDRNDARRDDAVDENGGAEESQRDAREQERAKKKKRRKQNIILTPEALKGPMENINPASMMMRIGDTQTTDLLNMATIPHSANRGRDLHLHSDVVLDTVDPTQSGNLTTVTCPAIRNLRGLNTCSSLANYELLGWSIDDEIDDVSMAEPSPVENGFHFDLDASLPAEGEASNAGMNFFDMDEDEDAERCERVAQPVANIVDFREILEASTHNQNFEYSYFQDSLDIQWAGPSHWKIRHQPRNLTGSRIVGRCDQEVIKRKKELNVAYNDDVAVVSKGFEEARTKLVKLQTKTVSRWSEEKITLPQDMRYNVSMTCDFYLTDKVKNFSKVSNDVNTSLVSDDVGNYDYNNEHDTTDYCPNVADDAVDVEENVAACTQAFMGDNLVELPKMTNEVTLAFTHRAKKIDMRQLKKCIWRNLVSSGNADKENVDASERSGDASREKVDGTVTFSTVFEQLPKTLSKNNVEALSLPIAFISLLHLANEKNLQIDSNEDQSDLFVRQG